MKIPHPRIVRSAMKHSLAAYEGIPGAIEFKVRRTSTQAYLVKKKAYQVLVFRGTKEPNDWLINLLAFPWRYGGRFAHRGFVKAHKSVWPLVAPKIVPGLPLILTGHSLGGALAELSSPFVVDHDAPVHQVTFGKPNVFFKTSEARLGHLKTQLSIVSGSDVVARVPCILYGPDPGQDILYLANDGNDYMNPAKDFMRKDFDPCDSLSDHSMGLYTERLESLL